LTLNSLYVNNLIAVNSTQQTIIDANATSIQVQDLYVGNSIHLNGTMQCTAGPLPTDCVDISGHSCPGGALDASCLPASAVFTNLQSTGTLTVNTVSCLGGAIPNNCVDISGKTCTSTLASSCIPLRVATINAIAPESSAGDFGITSGAGIVITPATNGIVVTNTGVTSVALTVPATLLSVSGSPVTTTGTLATSLVSQSANTLFAGPTTGASAAPTFRAQVLADLPQLTNGQLYVGSTGSSVAAATLSAGTGISVTNGAGSVTVANTGVTSVALAVPNIFSVSGSPVTTTGTLTASLATQSANTLFAGPTTGAAAAPTFRSQVLADLPQLTDGQLYVGSTGTAVAAATITAGSGISVTNGAGSITIAATGGGGTVTSVALSLPSIITVSGSPVTTSGTLTGTLATQSANTVFAGPTSGGAVAPTFRALVNADLSSALSSFLSSTDISTTINNAGPSQLGGFTSTPAAGKYLVTCTVNLSVCSGCTAIVGLRTGSSYVSGTQMNINTVTTRTSVTTQTIITLDGSTAIYVGWESSPAGVTTAFSRSFTVVRVV
jgi:hypothetical protein